MRATNVFYYLTYEGSVNLDSITDPVMREVCPLRLSGMSTKGNKKRKRAMLSFPINSSTHFTHV